MSERPRVQIRLTCAVDSAARIASQRQAEQRLNFLCCLDLESANLRVQGGSHIFPPLNGAVRAEVGRHFSYRSARAFSPTFTCCKQLIFATSRVPRCEGTGARTLLGSAALRAPGPSESMLLACWSLDFTGSTHRVSSAFMVHCYSDACRPGHREATAACGCSCWTRCSLTQWRLCLGPTQRRLVAPSRWKSSSRKRMQGKALANSPIQLARFWPGSWKK